MLCTCYCSILCDIVFQTNSVRQLLPSEIHFSVTFQDSFFFCVAESFVQARLHYVIVLWLFRPTLFSLRFFDQLCSLLPSKIHFLLCCRIFLQARFSLCNSVIVCRPTLFSGYYHPRFVILLCCRNFPTSKFYINCYCFQTNSVLQLRGIFLLCCQNFPMSKISIL